MAVEYKHKICLSEKSKSANDNLNITGKTKAEELKKYSVALLITALPFLRNFRCFTLRLKSPSVKPK